MSDGAPVVALHGSPGSHSNFAPVADVAACDGARLIAVDRAGYGHSTFDPTRSYERAATDIAELADHLHLEEFGVLGWSSGGPNRGELRPVFGQPSPGLRDGEWSCATRRARVGRWHDVHEPSCEAARRSRTMVDEPAVSGGTPTREPFSGGVDRMDAAPPSRV